MIRGICFFILLAIPFTSNAEDKAFNFFSASFYKPNYILPFYYTQYPDTDVYEDNTPENQQIDPTEVKFQFSLKVPVWHKIFNQSSTLYLAYTQLSYWQAYNSSAFFRETNYEPELFISQQLGWNTFASWKFSAINFAVSHQSNGRGGDLERGWNRLYLETHFEKENWLVSIKPWYIIRDSMVNTYNPDIGKYLGYEQILIAYQFHNQIFSLQTNNTFESGFQRGGVQLSWSVPLTKNVSGYLQLFTGYGQSLIEYNHYTNSVGVGISFSDWM